MISFFFLLRRADQRKNGWHDFDEDLSLSPFVLGIVRLKTYDKQITKRMYNMRKWALND